MKRSKGLPLFFGFIILFLAVLTFSLFKLKNGKKSRSVRPDSSEAENKKTQKSKQTVVGNKYVVRSTHVPAKKKLKVAKGKTPPGREHTPTRKEIYASQNSFEKFKKQRIAASQARTKNRLDMIFGDELTPEQKNKVLKKAAVARGQILDNQYRYHTGEISKTEALKEAAAITRDYAENLLKIMGKGNYTKYTGFSPGDDAWQKLMSASTPISPSGESELHETEK